jgi:RimJ/RimL family protein N-acetyltransferase
MKSPDHRRTKRLELTRLGPADLPDLIAFYADPEVTATLGGIAEPPWVEAYLSRQMEHWDRRGFGFWALREPGTGRFLGRGGIREAEVGGRLEIEVGYGLVRSAWGAGLATELARESVRVGFDELMLEELVAFSLPTNLASQRVMLKAGFRHEGDSVHAEIPVTLYRMTARDWRENRSDGSRHQG